MAAWLLVGFNSVSAQSVLSEQQASQVLSLEILEVTPARISGVIKNNMPHMVRDIKLLIQYHWLWENERNPGANPPGRAVTVELDGQLRPGESLPFDYTPSTALPDRNGGRFMTEVDIAGFTTVVPQQARQASAR
ncbi:MAG TPA: hypothetical protein VJQ55_01140 [Candidatus Binatia bacterium]|nr:hypothetical protein [Candidatus Binatia bacterium]